MSEWKMTREKVIRKLDRLEADLRSIETGLFGIRSQLRDDIDPHHIRRDLGYWPAMDPEPEAPDA